MTIILILIEGCASQPQVQQVVSNKKPMQAVMNECDVGQNFDLYAKCVKSTYISDGTRPDAPTSRAFLLQLDVISESFQNGNITQAQAKSSAYESYLKTIHADNLNEKAAANAAYLNGLGILQQQQQMQMMQQNQQMLQQQQIQNTILQKPVIRPPIQTQCYSNGNYVNCTTN